MAKPPPDFPLPAVHAALEAYINPRPTTLEKRRVLDVLVRELCKELDAGRTVPTRVEWETILEERLGRLRVQDKGKARGKFGWKKGDEEEMGMECPRREYLRAYRDRVEARRAWESVCEDEEEEGTDEELEDEEDIERQEKEFSGLFAHTLSLRTTLQSLILLRDYVSEFGHLLDEQPPTLPKDIKLHFPPPPAEANPSAQQSQTSNSRNASMLLPLQSQIYDVAREISTLRKLPSKDLVPRSGDKAQALLQTRNELIAWIEENLPSNLEGSVRNPETDDAPSKESQEQSIEKLEEAYEVYCNERETLCAAQKRLLSVPGIPNLKGISFTDPHEEEEIPGTPKRKQSVANIPTEQIHPHLHALTHTLPRLLARHKALVQDKSAIEVSISANSNIVSEAIRQHAGQGSREEPYAKQAKGWTDELAKSRGRLQGEVRAVLRVSEGWISQGNEAVEKVAELVGSGEGGWEHIDGGVGVIGGGI